LAAIIVDNLLSKALTKASEEVSQSKGLYIDLQLKTNQNDFENVSQFNLFCNTTFQIKYNPLEFSVSSFV
jgi:hypothetical protein